ncbi:MAG: M20/M25/M40 family metallo-hydrolase [Anaerolineae bacterium]
MKTIIETFDSQVLHTSLSALADWVIEQGIQIQQIAAPTFAEHARAEAVASMFRTLGLQEVRIDDVANVMGKVPGRHPELPATMIAAHTDTIFAADTNLSVRREPGIIYGPGLGDNSVGVSGMLGLARYLQQQQIQPEVDLWFAATTREEGLGDLGGMRAAFQTLAPHIDSVINLEGLAFGHIYHAGIAVRRLNITVTAPGGHSWLHYGKPSAVHVMVEVAARITALQPSKSPRTTFNIGMIKGGEAINAIATHAELWLDLRSESREALARFERQVRAQIEAVKLPDVHFEISLVGDRPAGYLDPAHPLVKAAVDVLDAQGIRALMETGSTDANVPLSEDCPAVTIGITRGGNAHRLDEYIETGPVAAGMRQLIVLALSNAAAKLAGTK